MENRVDPKDIYKYTIEEFNSIPEDLQEDMLKKLSNAKQAAEETVLLLEENKSDIVKILALAEIAKMASNMEEPELMLYSALYYELSLIKTYNNVLKPFGEAIDSGYYKTQESGIQINVGLN